jgi:hypothetical protein
MPRSGAQRPPEMRFLRNSIHMALNLRPLAKVDEGNYIEADPWMETS